MFQSMMFGMNLALVANNIGLMWVAVELATLTTVVMVGLYRTHEALEAAWKYFILGSVGIALALFGTTLVYVAALPVARRRSPSNGVDDLIGTSQLRSAILNLAFVFLLLAYGTKSASCRSWLVARRTCGRSDTDIRRPVRTAAQRRAVRVLRFKMLMAGNARALHRAADDRHGLASLTFGAFMLYRRRDIKRLFAYSSIEHMGIITFAFGVGGPLANFAGCCTWPCTASPSRRFSMPSATSRRSRHAEDSGDPRTDAVASAARLGSGHRCTRDRRMPPMGSS
jgi:hydrogenase-4 component F